MSHESHEMAGPQFIQRAVPDPPAVGRLTLEMIDDTDEFEGGPHRAVEVHGFDLNLPSGEPLLKSETGPVEERVFYFRVAGISHFEVDAQSPSFAPGQPILLVPEPSNPADPNAIRVMSPDMNLTAGYVPRAAAAVAAALLHSSGRRYATGVVTKTFRVGGKRNAIEVLGTVGRELELVGDVDTESGPTSGEDRWRSESTEPSV